jgi:hypothetical protein
MCAAVLSLEAITLGLTTPVMITIADVRPAPRWPSASGSRSCACCWPGMLRAEWAYVAGYLVQVAAIGLGFVVPVMFGLGIVFAALWTAADQLGRKIERERAAAWGCVPRRAGAEPPR